MTIGELRDLIALLPADGRVTVEVHGPSGVEGMDVVALTRINPTRGPVSVRLATDPVPRRPLTDAPRVRGGQLFTSRF